MKLFLHILTLLLFALPLQAAENYIDAAKNLAKAYCQNPTLKKTGVKTASQLRSASEEEPSYYIFSDDATDKFCIVSANADKVLGYGDNYSDVLPPQLQAALDVYAASTKAVDKLRSAETRENIPSFMDVVYSTRSPYNKYIPEREGSGPPVGCVPVCLAQICKYYEHPSKLLNDIPGYGHYSAKNPDIIYQIEGQKAEGRTYDWSLILNHYKKDTTEALNNEIAKLMWDCARSVETRFEQAGSAALSEMFLYSLVHYFGYNSDSLQYLSRDSYYREEWLDIIHEELSKKRPIYMSATSFHHGGHAFICDGYMDGYLHINWGWNGTSNGYYDVDIFDFKHDYEKEQTTPDNGYSFFQAIIIGIEPGEGKTVISRPASSSSIVPDSTVIIPDSVRIINTTTDIIGEYAKSVITLKAVTETKIPAGSMKYYALAVVADGDTLMSENPADFVESNANIVYLDRSLKMTDIDKEMSLIMMQTDTFTIDKDLDKNEWTLCEDFEPNRFKLSDYTIFSKELHIDTIVHTTNGSKHRFDITFSNPTPFEFYDDVYFMLEEYTTGLMLSIPAGGTTQKTIEHDMPELTSYIQSTLAIIKDDRITARYNFVKDTFSHIFYGLSAEDESTISLKILNTKSKNYDNTFVLLCGSDSVSSQTASIEPEKGVQFLFSLPAIVGDTDSLQVNYANYSVFDKDNTLLGKVTPLKYYGTISQFFDKDEKIISVELKPTDVNKMSKLIIGVTSSLEDEKSYEKLVYEPEPGEQSISIAFMLSNYCSIEKPKYIGLCKENGSFYAYMELTWTNTNGISDILSDNLSIVSADGGIWITSDTDIPSLPIVAVDGKIVSTIGLNRESSLFVPLTKGIYIVGNQKVMVK